MDNFQFLVCMIIIDLLVTIFLHFDLKYDIERKIDERFNELTTLINSNKDE